MPPSEDSDSPTQQTRLDLTELDALVRTHAARLASFLRRRVGNPQDVEDLVQDTLLEAVRCIDQFQGQSKPETWLFGIALNLTRTYYKRAKVRDIYGEGETDTESVPSNGADNPADIAEHRERMRRVEAAMRKLPEDSHRLLQYAVQDDLSYEEMAQHLGIPIGTVRSRISRVRAGLKRHADGGDGGPSPPLLATNWEHGLQLFGIPQAA